MVFFGVVVLLAIVVFAVQFYSYSVKQAKKS
jgi:hypothetical protein